MTRQMVTGLLWLAMFLSCNRPSEDSSNNYNHIFHYNQPNNITSLDPAFARSQSNIWAVDHLYNGLLQLDDSLRIQACIAKSWEISEDGLTYRFVLRDDVHFHPSKVFANGEGRRVIADDVVYSFSRILDEAVQSPGSWIFMGNVRKYQPFVAVNDTVFELHLQRTFLPILGILTMPYAYIVPHEAVSHFGMDFRTHPVGTGPFVFKNWIEGQALAMTKHKNYFLKNTPCVDGIFVSFMADRKTAFLELQQGKIDFLSGLAASYAQSALQADGELTPELRSSIQFIKAPYLNTEYLGIHMQYGGQDHPLRNKLVRQALNYGFDREVMLRTLRRNVGVPATEGFIPKGLPAFAEKSRGYNYNPKRALELLEAAGYPNAQGMPPLTLHVNSDYMDLCTFIARQWEEIGIETRIELVESATLRQMMSNGQTAFFRASWIADYPDAESFLTVFYGGNEAPPNYTRFKNKSYDRLYEQALKTVNEDERYALYQKMDSILIEEAPVVFLYYDQTALFARKEVTGISRNALNLLKVDRICTD